MDMIAQLGPALGVVLTIILTIVGIVVPQQNGTGSSSSGSSSREQAQTAPQTPGPTTTSTTPTTSTKKSTKKSSKTTSTATSQATSTKKSTKQSSKPSSKAASKPSSKSAASPRLTTKAQPTSQAQPKQTQPKQTPTKNAQSKQTQRAPLTTAPTAPNDNVDHGDFWSRIEELQRQNDAKRGQSTVAPVPATPRTTAPSTTAKPKPKPPVPTTSQYIPPTMERNDSFDHGDLWSRAEQQRQREEQAQREREERERIEREREIQAQQEREERERIEREAQERIEREAQLQREREAQAQREREEREREERERIEREAQPADNARDEIQRRMQLPYTHSEADYINNLNVDAHQKLIAENIDAIHGRNSTFTSTTDGWYFDNPRNVVDDFANPADASRVNYAISQGNRLRIVRSKPNSTERPGSMCTVGYVEPHSNTVYTARHCFREENGEKILFVRLITPDGRNPIVAYRDDVLGFGHLRGSEHEIPATDLSGFHLNATDVAFGNNRFSGDTAVTQPVAPGDTICMLNGHGAEVSCSDALALKDELQTNYRAEGASGDGAIGGDSGGPVWRINPDTGATEFIGTLFGRSLKGTHSTFTAAYLFQGISENHPTMQTQLNNHVYNRALNYR